MGWDTAKADNMVARALLPDSGDGYIERTLMPETKPKPFVLIAPGQTPITAPELVAKLREGARLADLAKWLGYSESHVRSFLKAAGYTTKAQPSLWVDQSAQSAAEAESNLSEGEAPDA